jgi:hypothetical protein
MQDSIVRARRKIAARARCARGAADGGPWMVEINGKAMPTVTVNMDGVGAKRALNYNLNGSPACPQRPPLCARRPTAFA